MASASRSQRVASAEVGARSKFHVPSRGLPVILRSESARPTETPMRTLLLLAIIAGAAHAELSVGFAEVDVTPKLEPDKPVYIAGFSHNRKATKVHDPIMARAIVLSDGKRK